MRMNKKPEKPVMKNGNKGMEKEKGVIKISAKKPTAVYTPYLLSTLMSEGKVEIIARGKAMVKAIDLAEVTRHKLVKGCKIEKIETNTESMPLRDSTRNINVSTIRITLIK